MNEKEIIEIFNKEYKMEKMNGTDNSLRVKLLQTTQEFARSFEYELPNAFGLKAKLAKFVKRVIRKLTRFILNPYAEQMLKFEESICELQGAMIDRIYQLENDLLEEKKLLQKREKDIESQEEVIRDLENKCTNHEVAIYKLTQAFNDNDKLTLELSNSTADIKQYLFGEKDDVFRGYSQAGEDAIIEFILNYGEQKRKGASYLDIGCNRYKELNNSYHFYEKGMRGVLIDANPKFIDEIRHNRPEDTVLNMGVGIDSGKSMTFYALNWDWLSSFNKDEVDEVVKESEWVKVEQEIKVPIITLNEIYEKYFFSVPAIVSIDIEGDELAILKSVDMEKYRPLIYVVETIKYSSKISIENKRMDIIEYMKSVDYYEYAFTGVNSIFIDRRKFV